MPCLGANAEGVTSAWTRTAISPAHAAKRHQAVCLPPRTHILKRHKSGTLACFRVSVSVIAVGEDAGRWFSPSSYRLSLDSRLLLLYSTVFLSLLSPSRLRLRSPPAEGLGGLYRRVQLLHAAVHLGRRLHVRQLAVGQGEQRTS